VFRTDDDFDPAMPLALHTVTQCDLGGASLRCEASAVLAPAGRVFYVSAGSVYVWTTGIAALARRAAKPEPGQPQSALFRLPLDGSPPSAIKTAGVPVDQMSFLEDREATSACCCVKPVTARACGQRSATRAGWRCCACPCRRSAMGARPPRWPGTAVCQAPTRGAVQNRHIGDWLIWGGEDGAWALQPAARDAETALVPGHAVERIEALGEHALLVGRSGSELRFSAVRLQRGRAALAGSHRVARCAAGRDTHARLLLPSTGREEGLLGLPVLPSQGMHDAAGRGRAVRIAFLRHRGLGFAALGELAAAAATRQDDGCKASCVDWYGNARPIFLGSRVLALMGYDLVEGQVAGRGGDERIETRRSISFAPMAQRWPGGRPSPFE
jgi:hypothetical protein